MPNWCENQLKISGNNISQFLEAVKGKPAVYYPGETTKKFSKEYYEKSIQEYWEEMKNNKEISFTFHSLVPVPDEILKKGYNDAGYNWQIENWGTKWDIRDDYRSNQIDENNLVYYFDSAWSPPEEWVKRASESFPQLTFELSYFESGVGFAGSTTFQGGEVIDETYADGNFPEIKEILINFLGYTEEDVDDMYGDCYDDDDDDDDDDSPVGDNE